MWSTGALLTAFQCESQGLQVSIETEIEIEIKNAMVFTLKIFIFSMVYLLQM